jgi:HEPN domain-containing protein
MNRGEFQELAMIRIHDAKVLLENKCFDGAYYLSGYAIECALKACIAKKTKEFDYPDKKLVDKIYTHDFSKLIGVVGLKVDESIAARWGTVKDWSEQDRYRRHTEKEARDMYDAVANSKEGVLEWIKQHW